MRNKKVIVLGLDGATWDIILPFVKKGKLPAFKYLIENGICGHLESTIPPSSPSAWTSIFTGATPGKHGIFGFVKQKKNSYFITPISSKDRKVDPVWKILSDNGKKVILLNIPFTYPPDKVNGIMTTGLGTPSKKSDFTYPIDYKNELLNKFPNYDVDFNEDLILLTSDIESVLSNIELITDEQIRLGKYLLKKEKWDLFALVLRASDVIQHYCWDNKDAIFNFYQQADIFIKWLIDSMDDDTLLLICSDHGFSQVHTRVFINNWLEEVGLLKMNKKSNSLLSKYVPSAEFFQKVLVKFGLKNVIWKLKRSRLLEPMMHIIPSSKLQHLSEIKWSETKAYFLDGLDGAINVNLKSREPEGIVTNEDYKKVKEQTIGEIMKLNDKNKNVLIEACDGKELYGNILSNTPDICLLRNNGYRLMGGYNYSGKICEKELERNGEHSKQGIFLAYGSGVKSGKAAEDAKVYDITPTILYILGLPMPKIMDGRVLKEIFKEGSDLAKMEIKYNAERDIIKDKIKHLKNIHKL